MLVEPDMDKRDLGSLIYTYDMATGEALGKRENHTPKIEAPPTAKPDQQINLKITVGPHPNTVEHSIRWIAVFFQEEGRAFNPIILAKVSFNAPTTEPEITLSVKFAKSGVIHALEYCNLHGLWSGRKEITIG
jgi:superoxide reductase